MISYTTCMPAATAYEVGQLQKKKEENGTADLQSKASSVLTQKRRKCFVWKMCSLVM